MPISIRMPIIEIMLKVVPEINMSRNEPIRLKGMQVITIRLKRTLSNCMAITRNTRNTAVKMDFSKPVSSSFCISCSTLELRLTPWGSSSLATAASMLFCAVQRAVPVVEAVTAI